MSIRAGDVFFLLMCILVAARDVFSQVILVKSVDPLYMLTVYCFGTTLFSVVYRALRLKTTDCRKLVSSFERRHWRIAIKLGVATWIVYGATVFGIAYLGAPTFNFVDFGASPIITAIAAIVLQREHPSIVRTISVLLGCVGFLFLVGPLSYGDLRFSSLTGLILAVVSAVFTSLSAVYQKQLIQSGMNPEEALMLRFPIPSLLMLGCLLFRSPEVLPSALPSLLVVCLFGVFLPLLFLCLGFVKESVSKFASFLFLIPLFTALLGALVIDAEQQKVLQWNFGVGAALIVLSCLCAIKADSILESGERELEQKYD